MKCSIGCVVKLLAFPKDTRDDCPDRKNHRPDNRDTDRASCSRRGLLSDHDRHRLPERRNHHGVGAGRHLQAAPQFKFDRACLFNPESRFHNRDYDGVDSILLPNTFTHWTLVLIDDSNKTYRTLYAHEPDVKLGRLGCVPKITLRTEIRNGELTAYVEEDYAH